MVERSILAPHLPNKDKKTKQSRLHRLLLAVTKLYRVVEWRAVVPPKFNLKPAGKYFRTA
jgi:hypothetical protein